MAKRNFTFENGGIYHVYNRGVDKRKTFMDEADHSRMVYLLEVCNSGDHAPRNIKRYVHKQKGNYQKIQDVQGRTLHILYFITLPQVVRKILRVLLFPFPYLPLFCRCFLRVRIHMTVRGILCLLKDKRSSIVLFARFLLVCCLWCV